MNEQKKQLYLVFGAAIVLHILFFASMYVVYGLGIIAAAVLIAALWKATSGRRLGMNAALIVSLIATAPYSSPRISSASVLRKRPKR